MSQSKTALPKQFYDLTLVLALKLLEITSKEASNTGHLLKCCNVLYKLLDRVNGDFELNKTAIETQLQSILLNYLPISVEPTM